MRLRGLTHSDCEIDKYLAGAGAFMKGRKKVKTQKWHLRAQFEADARALTGTQSAHQEQFMRAATRIGRTAEPVGAMAGVSNADSCAY